MKVWVPAGTVKTAWPSAVPVRVARADAVTRAGSVAGTRTSARACWTLSEAGLSVPGDISLAGYDNTTFAAFSPISLTTVDQAGHHIGSEAARLLLDRIATRDRPAAQVKLAPALVERRTTAPPAS